MGAQNWQREMGGPAFNMHQCPLSKLPSAGDIPCLPYSPMWNITSSPSLAKVTRMQFLLVECCKSKVSIRSGNETGSHRGLVYRVKDSTGQRRRCNIGSTSHNPSMSTHRQPLWGTCQTGKFLFAAPCCPLVATYDSTVSPPDTRTPYLILSVFLHVSLGHPNQSPGMLL